MIVSLKGVFEGEAWLFCVAVCPQGHGDQRFGCEGDFRISGVCLLNGSTVACASPEIPEEKAERGEAGRREEGRQEREEEGEGEGTRAERRGGGRGEERRGEGCNCGFLFARQKLGDLDICQQI